MIKYAIFALALAGCDGGDDQALSHDLSEFNGHLDALRVATEDHGAEVHSATILSAIAKEEGKHATGADDHMKAISMEMDQMTMCEDDMGMHPDMGSMTDAHENCIDEMQAHAKAMAKVADLDAAHSEETRHQTATEERLDEMERMGSMMMDMAEMFMCDERDDTH